MTSIELIDALGVLRAGPLPEQDLDPNLVTQALAAGIIIRLPDGLISINGSYVEECVALRAAGTPIFGVDITETGLRIHGTLTKEGCIEALRRLQRLRCMYHSAVADVLTHARTNHGQAFVEEMLEQLEFSLDDVQKAHAIQHVPRLLRDSAKLTSEHAYVLGRQFPDDTNEQEKWAKLSVEHNLSALALKRSIASGKIYTEENIQSQSGRGSGIPVINGLVSVEFKRWLNKIGGRDRVLGWPDSVKLEFLEEVEELYELAKAVEASIEKPRSH